MGEGGGCFWTFEVAVPEGVSSPDSVPSTAAFPRPGACRPAPGTAGPSLRDLLCRLWRSGNTHTAWTVVRQTHSTCTFPRGVVPGERLPYRVLLIRTPLAGTAWGPGLLQAEPALFVQVAFLPSRCSDRQGEELQTGLFGFPGTTWRHP